MNKNGKVISIHRSIMERILKEQGNSKLLKKFRRNPRKYQIDHIDGNGLNNTRDNLRIVSCRQNNQNRHISKSSKYPGVSFNKFRGKWHAYIRVGKKRKHLGYFNTEEEAFNVYKHAVKDLTGENVINH